MVLLKKQSSYLAKRRLPEGTPLHIENKRSTSTSQCWKMSLVLGMDFFFGCGDGCGPLNGVFQPPGGKPLGALGGSTLDPSVAKFSAAALPGEDGGLYCAAGPCCQRGMALSAAGGALSGYCLGCPPAQDAIVTTRIITFVVGNPKVNLHLPLESWEGGQPKVLLWWPPWKIEVCFEWFF